MYCILFSVSRKGDFVWTINCSMYLIVNLSYLLYKLGNVFSPSYVYVPYVLYIGISQLLFLNMHFSFALRICCRCTIDLLDFPDLFAPSLYVLLNKLINVYAFYSKVKKACGETILVVNCSCESNGKFIYICVSII